MATQQPQQIDPHLLEQGAQQSPTLAYMIENNLPLTREQWMSMNYLGHPPEEWTDAHEAEVPAVFRQEQA